MKILSYLNVSNVDDIECDSGYIFNYTIASELSSRGVRVDIIFPSELRGRINKISSDSQHFVEMGHTKYEVRYHFSWNELKRLIELLQPDVIFLNQAELTAHMKALLVEMGLDQAIKIVSYCHYPALHLNDDGKPCKDYSLDNGGLGEDIIDNLFSALNIADLFFVQSNFAKRLLLDYANSNNKPIKKEIYILSPPYDNCLNDVPVLTKKRNAVLYNHRLYDSYGTREFIDFVCSNSEFNFIVTDPMINRGSDRSRFNSSPTVNRISLMEQQNVKVVDGSRRSSYIEAIDSCKVAIAPYRRACVWSMAVVDCFCRGLPVIGPDFAAFVELIPEFLRYKTPAEERTILRRLLNDSDFWNESTYSCRKILDSISPAVIVDSLMCQIERIIK